MKNPFTDRAARLAEIHQYVLDIERVKTIRDYSVTSDTTPDNEIDQYNTAIHVMAEVLIRLNEKIK